MSDNERTVMRLQKMRVKARNASQAEALLSHLCVFQEPFGRSAIVGMTPKEMDKSTRIAAFATLRSWNIVKQISSKRFSVEASIRALFPPTDAIRLEQLNFFIGCVSVYDQIWAQLRWGDLSSALQWALNHQPLLGIELAQKIRHNTHFSSIHEQRVIMEAVYAAASQQKHLEMQAYALRQLGGLTRDPETAYEYYEQALAVYQAQGDSENQGDILLLMGRLLWKNRQRSEACNCYKHAQALFEITKRQRKSIDALRLIYQSALKMENIIDTPLYLNQLFPFLNSHDQAAYSYELARFMRWKKQYIMARQYFAQAYFVEEQIPIVDDWPSSTHINILRDWAVMEYESGNQNHGYALCHLAISRLLQMIEIVYGDPKDREVAWYELSHLSIVFQAAGCPDLPNYTIPM